MCLGNNQTTSTKTITPPAWLSSAATGNLDYVKQLADQGFQGYAGNQVAGFSPQQQQSFYAAGGLAGALQPYTGDIGRLASNYASAGPSSVNADTIASRMSPYMNAYVAQALQPQISLQNQQFADQNKQFNSQATGAGAFGDTSHQLGLGNLTQQQDIARTGLIGNAYNAAFNTAIGAGAQDVSNNLNAQTTNANLNETALQRQLGGANFLYGAGSGVTNLNNQFGAQQTAQSQAGLNAAYNQWLMKQQYPFQVAGLMNSTIGASRAGAPITETNSAPNNAGYGLIGAGIGALGTIGGAMIGGPVGAGIGGALGSAVGGGLSSQPYTSGPNGSSWAPNPNGGGWSPTYYAKGGRPEPGKPAIVGEKGPELFVPDRPGTIIPHHMLKKAMADKKGGRKLAAPVGGDGLAAQLGIAA